VTDFGQPTRKDHQNFCLNEGWTQVRNARGKGGHHVTFELTFPTARYSAPESRTYRTVRPTVRAFVAHILRDQLDVGETSSRPASGRGSCHSVAAASRSRLHPRRSRGPLPSHGSRSRKWLMSRAGAIER
jgi:hypothetical protein